MTATITVLGFTEEMTECSFCGKMELKGTYAVEFENVIYYLGSSCFKKKFNLTQKEVVAKIKEGYNRRLKLANEEFESSEEYKADHFHASKIEEIRIKYNLEKKHFGSWGRKYTI